MKPLIVANWKMNPQALAEAKKLFNSAKRGIKNIKNVEIVICPPFPYLSNVNCQMLNVKLGAQDCFWEDSGAFTGEISPLMLKNLGCEYIIIGHSERRKLGETDKMINKKIKAALQSKLKPILCIGETKEKRGQGKTFKILKNQIQKALNNLTIKQLNNLTIAYEPIWAIGSGNPCSHREAKKVLLFLRKLLRKIPILYGGSVNSQNTADYIKKAGFSGLLVGSASLNSKEFIKIVKSVARS